MLVRLFWHQPAAHQPVDTYEQALVAFHRRLWDVAAPGLVASGTARVRGLPAYAIGVPHAAHPTRPHPVLAAADEPKAEHHIRTMLSSCADGAIHR
jgi:hypothetical protein